MSISTYFSSRLNYLYYGKQKTDQVMAEDIETGVSSQVAQSIFKPDAPGTIRISAKDVFVAERNQLQDPPQAPGTAAGNPVHFMPRQRFLLDEKYRDREGRTIRGIGNVIYNNLAKTESENGVPSIIDLNTANNLGLLSVKEAKLASNIDRTTTKMGGAYLRLLLSRPTAEIEMLQSRQGMIKGLMEDQVLSELQTYLKEMGETEVHLLSCWDSEKQLPGSSAALYYRMNPKVNAVLNNSALALDFSALSGTAKKVINTAMQAVSGVLFAAFAMYETGRALTDTETPEWVTGYADRFIGTTPLGSPAALALLPNNPVVNASIAATASYGCLASLESTYGWLIADTAMLPLMRSVLSSVATQYKNMKKIQTLLQDKPEITQGLEHFSKLEDFLADKELQPLFRLLDSFSFNKGNNYLFRPGEVLLVWELLHSSSFKKKKSEQEGPKTSAPGDKIRATFEKVMPAIGEIDAFLSAALLMQNSQEDQHSRVKYQFPHFIRNAQPVLQIQGMWNPRIDQEKAIPTNVSLGGPNWPQGMVITGPNKGGKSCLGQGIAAAVTMAQSLGIAPAESMTLTPFNYVRTSMDVQGSVEEAESLFSAQSKSIGQIQAGVKNVAQLGGFSLSVLDEPLSGTNAKSGAELVSEVAESLTKEDTNLSIIITHYPDVALKVGSKYKPYQVKGNGSRTLEAGVYTDSNAREIAAAHGVKDLKE